jgi:hypothetical protein
MNRLIQAFILALTVLGLSNGARAEDAPAPAAPSVAPVIELQAIDALKRMGAYLRTLQAFSVTSETLTDEVLLSGQKVQVAGTSTIIARRPDRLYAAVKKDETDLDREYFYDGKTFTIYGKNVKYYASRPAPGTLREVVEALADKGVSIPLADLFSWGSNEDTTKVITSAVYIGPATIRGVATDHYAFRQPDVDWQIWIEKGKSPLPRKLVITTTDEEGQPQYMALLNWNQSPKISDKTFTFVPPKGSHKIVFADRPASAGK